MTPLVERCRDIVAADVEHSLGVGTASLLQAPRRRVVEVKSASTRARVLLLEVVASLKAGVGLKLSIERVATTVEVASLPAKVEVVNGIARYFATGRR